MITLPSTELDRRIRDAVLEQLRWDPAVDATALVVTAHDGAVSLAGFINTYAGKLAAERAAKRVRGVRAVANDIAVHPTVERTDGEIAADAVRALELRESVPDTVQAVVHNARITLTGTVPFLHQAREAEKAIRHIKSVRGVFNRIKVDGAVVERDVRQRITAALHRSADIDARRVIVAIDGNVAVLTGTVGTWGQYEAAEHAAAGAPGIACVDNRLAVAPEVELADEIC
jgi:osmotically-inducible protein OsmY